MGLSPCVLLRLLLLVKPPPNTITITVRRTANTASKNGSTLLSHPATMVQPPPASMAVPRSKDNTRPVRRENLRARMDPKPNVQNVTGTVARQNVMGTVDTNFIHAKTMPPPLAAMALQFPREHFHRARMENQSAWMVPSFPPT